MSEKQKIAVVLFNLGGPDTPEAIKPFLRNLFSDPRIISLPGPLRQLVALLISTRRAPKVKPLYAHMGGASPILANTQAQADALEQQLNQRGDSQTKLFIAMRYWHPRTNQVLQQIQAYAPDKIILLPLYPQFSTTTTESSLIEWQQEIRHAGLNIPVTIVGCYPLQPGFIAAEAALIRPLIEQAQREHPATTPLLLFSAHGLPERIITQKGDPYAWQVEQTAQAIVTAIGLKGYDHLVSYQSRVGPVEWLKPYTDATIRQASAQKRPLIIAPIAFVSEHIETLVELDIENRHLAQEAGCPGYYRAPTVSIHPDFIQGLAELVENALEQSARPPLCPPQFTACACRQALSSSLP